MNYVDLSIHEKIGLKGLLRQWAEVARDKFGESLQDKVYGLRVRRANRRTNRLYNDWQVEEKGGTDDPGILISSLYYGRFVDLGVGRGAKKGSVKARQRARRWYTPVKYRELAILRSLVIKRYSVSLLTIVDRQFNAGGSASGLTVNI